MRLFKPMLVSIVNKLLVLLAAYLVEQGVWTKPQGDQFVSQNGELLAGAILFLISLGISWVQHRAARDLVTTAHAASPTMPIADVVRDHRALDEGWLAKLLASLALVAILPGLASAQSLRDQALALSAGYTLQQQPASASIVPGVEDTTVLRTAQGIFAAGVTADAWAACNAVRQRDTAGNPINAPSNAVVPAKCGQIIMEKVGVGIAALVASSKLWPDEACKEGCALRKLEAIGTLAATGAAFFASAMTSVYEKPPVGVFPVPAHRIAVSFALRR